MSGNVVSERRFRRMRQQMADGTLDMDRMKRDLRERLLQEGQESQEWRRRRQETKICLEVCKECPHARMEPTHVWWKDLLGCRYLYCEKLDNLLARVWAGRVSSQYALPANCPRLARHMDATPDEVVEMLDKVAHVG